MRRVIVTNLLGSSNLLLLGLLSRLLLLLLWCSSGLLLLGLLLGRRLLGRLLLLLLFLGLLRLLLLLWCLLRGSSRLSRLSELGATGRTLGLLEDTLLNADLQGLVEERVEHLVANVDGVVGLDILLQGWAADGVLVCGSVK